MINPCQKYNFKNYSSFVKKWDYLVKPIKDKQNLSGMLVARLGDSFLEGGQEGVALGYTKHYFAGTQRVSSKIGTTENLGDFLQDWFTAGIGGPGDVVGSSFGVLENAEEGVVQVYTELGIDPPTYDSDPVFIPVASFIHGDNETEQYFFHPDHLGSTSYITNLLGEVSQHIEYFAFGDTFVEEHRNSNNSSYKFNAKELDEETGLYYYGARYYDPRVSNWLSVDPLAEQTMTPYQYTYQNPVRYIDPTGMAADAPPSTGVIDNKDGTYTVVSGNPNDGDTGIYLADENGNYNINTSEKIGNTLNPWDFIGTDDSTGEFNGAKKGVIFNPNSELNFFSIGSQYNFEGNGFSAITDLAELAMVSRNNGRLDIKEKYGAYTTVVVSAEDKIYTTVRYTSNVNFGKNMRNIYDKHYGGKKNRRAFDFYTKVMPIVGWYNQSQNNGNGYNSGYPFYGEHTYSGTGIFNGFFSRFNFSTFIRP